MTLDTFFEKFELLADAPDAVGRMRELVLELATQGKLVERIRSEGTGFEILEQVGVESSVPDEAPNVPDHWVWSRLENINTGMNSGWSPACLSEPANEGEWGVLKTTAVQPLEYRERENKKLPQNLAPRPENEVQEGDILFTRAGPMNRVGVLCVARPTRQQLMISDKIIRFHLLPGIDPDFAALAMNTGHSGRVIEGLKSGMAASQVNISQPKLRSVPIPLPPLAEQKRIVAKVEELMALCDRLEAQQQERATRHAALARASLSRFAEAPTPANLNLLFHPSYDIPPAELRKAILTLAVQGKLVEQDPKEEPAESWLRAFAKDPSEVDGEPPFPLPKGWIWLQTATVFEVAGGIQKTPLRAPRSNAFPYLGVGNVYRGRLDLTNLKEFELEPGELERRRLVAGDLLIIEGNGSFNEIGRCAKWRGEVENCVHQNHVIRCRPCDDRISDFVLLYLNSPLGMEIMQRLAITSSGLYSLSVGKIRQIEIPIPPLAEQRRIGAKVEQLMALVDRLDARLTASRDSAGKLLEAVVGELTAAGSLDIAGRISDAEPTTWIR